jgi:hypothetical protein
MLSLNRDYISEINWLFYYLPLPNDFVSRVSDLGFVKNSKEFKRCEALTRMSTDVKPFWQVRIRQSQIHCKKITYGGHTWLWCSRAGQMHQRQSYEGERQSRTNKRMRLSGKSRKMSGNCRGKTGQRDGEHGEANHSLPQKAGGCLKSRRSARVLRQSPPGRGRTMNGRR